MVTLCDNRGSHLPCHNDGKLLSLIDKRVFHLIKDFHAQFSVSRNELLKEREKRQKEFDQGKIKLGVYPKNRYLENQDGLKPIEIDDKYQDRRAELCLPGDNFSLILEAISSFDKIVPNTLIFDFDESVYPSLQNISMGMLHIRDIIVGDFIASDRSIHGKLQELRHKKIFPNIGVRIREIAKNETELLFNNLETSASLVDLVLLGCIVVPELLPLKSNLIIYLSNCDSYKEARWWKKIISALEQALGLTKGTFKVSIGIDTLSACYQVKEIIHELRDYVVSINTNPTKILLSYLKMFRNEPSKFIPDILQLQYSDNWVGHLTSMIFSQMSDQNIPCLIETNIVYEDYSFDLPTVFYNFTMACKTNGATGLILLTKKFINQTQFIFSRLDLGSKSIETKKKSPEVIFPISEGLFKEKSFKEFIKRAIYFLKSWDEKKGISFYGHYIDTISSFELIRWCTWSFNFHKEKISPENILTNEVVGQLFDDALNEIIEEEKISAPHEMNSFFVAKNRGKQLFFRAILREFIEEI